MYVGTNYNSYYNSLFGSRSSSVYGSLKNTNNNYSLTNLYNQNKLNTETVSYVQDLKSTANTLKSAVNSLGNSSTYNQTTLASSNTDILTVQTSGKQNNLSSQTVQVQQLATAQKNEGTALNSSSAAGLSGYQQFALEVGGKTHQISFTANAGDSNATIQQKMADAINSKDIGVTASVNKESLSGTSSLILTAKDTGAQNTFAISDTLGTAVAQMGADTVATAAQDAEYRVNGGSLQTSASNKIDLGNGITATLKKASSETVTIARGTDTEATAQKMQDFVKAYNDLYNTALSKSGSDEKAYKLFNKLITTNQTYVSSLDSIGIAFDDNGKMSINSEKLAAAQKDGTLEAFFTKNQGSNYGYLSQLGKISADVSTNTQKYVSQSSFTTNSSSDSSDKGWDMINQIYGNPYSYLTQMNQVNAVGMLFDFSL